VNSRAQTENKLIVDRRPAEEDEEDEEDADTSGEEGEGDPTGHQATLNEMDEVQPDGSEKDE
jgi:hypothetical protein